MIAITEDGMDLADKTVLLVDDEPLFTSSLGDALKGRHPGLHILFASTGQEALDRITRFKVHAMVLDVHMPQLSGLELLSVLSEQGIYLPVILVTAHGSDEIAALSQHKGVVAYLEKPVNVPTLLDLIARLLHQPEAGHVSGVSLPGFMQLVSMEQTSCAIHVIGSAGHGMLSFQAGVLVFARCGQLDGDEAVIEVATWLDAAIYVESNPRHHEDYNVDSPVMELLLEVARRSDEAVTPSPPTADHDTQPSPQSDQPLPAASVASTPCVVPSDDKKDHAMAMVDQTLDHVMAIDGALAVALVNYETGMMLSTRCSEPGFDIERAAGGNTQILRTNMAVMHDLAITGAIEDILITLNAQCHLLRPLSSVGSLFLYLAIDRKSGNLALARHRLSVLEKELHLPLPTAAHVRV